MQIIGITTPHLWEDEAKAIVSLLEHTLNLVHIRKPDASTIEVEALIRRIPQEYHTRLVLHNQHDLARQFAFKAIHLNRYHPAPPADYTGALTRSCHGIAELCEIQDFAYVFLSPIYDSISKQGYTSGFNPEILEEARKKGLINHKVIALGGITPLHFPQLQSYGFGGAAMLGHLWNPQK